MDISIDTLGVVETKTIAAGVNLTDGMLKAANVDLIRSGTICSGRYVIYIAGKRENVETSVRFAEGAGYSLMGSFVISHIAPEVLQALKRAIPQEKEGDAIAIVECKNVSAGIAAADVAVKRSASKLLRFVAGQAINGKSYFILSGDVATVNESAEAARDFLDKNLVDLVVIPRPDVELVRSLTKGAMR